MSSSSRIAPRTSVASVGPVLLSLFVASIGCDSEREVARPDPVTPGPVVAAARALVDEVVSRFTRPVEASAGISAQRLFAAPDPRSFVTDAKGHLRFGVRPSSAAPSRAGMPAATRAEVAFPRLASEGVRIQVAGHDDAWLAMRPAAADVDAERALIDGLVVYRGMVAGADAIYVVSDERVEEFLVVRDAEQARSLTFDIELGPAIASLRVDGSGAGLEALDQQGRVVLRAPMPEGRDANGAYVGGRLAAAPTDRDGGLGRWRIHVALTTEAPAYPVLLDPSWAGTGTMATARTGHSATMLPNGKVLFAGGSATSAELYDPATRTYSATGPLQVPRGAHAATRLADGKVLIVGGFFSDHIASAEVYDPAEGTFTLTTGPMATARNLHTATLLPSGKVLIAGGFGASGPRLRSAELYDPDAKTFTATGDLVIARALHTATFRRNNEVLIAGGNSGDAALGSAELYDAGTGTFSATGNLAVGRSGHAAVLLFTGDILVVGGAAGETALASAEFFGATSQQFTTVGSLVTARNRPTATVLDDGRVLVVGGLDAVAGEAIATTEIYDVGRRTFANTGADLRAARWDHTATSLGGGAVLVSGGRPYGGAPLTSSELFDPHRFIGAGTLLMPRFAPTATLLTSGKVLIVGGYRMDAEIYDPASGTSTATVEPPRQYYYQTATLLASGKVLLAGGTFEASAAELYDPALDTFTAVGPMSMGRAGHSATLLLSGQVLLAGGAPEGIDSAELYDPTTETFGPAFSMPGSLTVHSATRLSSGHVLLFEREKAFLYDPATGQFTNLSEIPLVATKSLTLLPSGKVLLSGTVVLSASPSSYLFDPATTTFTATGSPGLSYQYPSAAVLLASGKVLFASENDVAELYDPALEQFTFGSARVSPRYHAVPVTLPSGRVILFGGITSGGVSLAAIDLYDPTHGAMSATGNPPSPRSDPTATLLASGEVLIAGPTPSAVLYDPTSGTFQSTGSMASTRSRATATLLPSGKVLIAGGLASGTTITVAELYDRTSGTFTATGAARVARSFHSATLLGSGQVLVTGGVDPAGDDPNRAELYDPATGEFSDVGSMTTPRSRHTATLLHDGSVLVVGGSNNLASAERYDPRSRTFSATPGSLAVGRAGHSATLLPSGRVLIVGGVAITAAVEVFDPATGTFTTTGSLGFPRGYHRATLLASGRVLVSGGEGDTLSPPPSITAALATTEIYEPLTGQWTPSVFMQARRTEHVAVRLGSDRVLLTGGKVTPMSADLFDEGVGYADEARPVITSISGELKAGATLTIAGSKLVGIEGGSGIQTEASATNYPLVRLVRDGSDQVLFAPTQDTSGAWKDTSTTLTATLPLSMNGGVWRLSVVRNGLTSLPRTIAVTQAPRRGDACGAGVSCFESTCVDGACCDSQCGDGADDCMACSVAAGAAVDGTCGPLASAACGGEYVAITAIGAPVVEDFDTLASAATSADVPTGWRFVESGAGANEIYSVGSGTAATGDTYSFGASGSSERAFGTLRSGNVAATIGAHFGNDTGLTIRTIAIAYTGEQWRLGAAGRTDRLDFEYTTHADGLTDGLGGGTWTAVDGLDFVAPRQSAPTGAVDGQAAENRTELELVLSGLAIAPGESFWIRWTDFDPAGADDGLAVDDFTLTALCSTDGDCDDASVCTTDTCEPTSGLCTHASIACDDQEACTSDSCVAATGCVFTPLTSACDDGDACTVGDACAGGTCGVGAARDCDDGKTCTNDSCDAVLGCQHADRTGSCDDGLLTTRDDTCDAGACVGTTIVCQANACQTPGSPNGSTCPPVPRSNTESCDDGLASTKEDHCDGAGACTGTAYSCTPETCQASSVPNGSDCTVTPASAGSPCNDGDACTSDDQCTAGACAGTPIVCDPGEICAGSLCFSTHCAPCDEPSACGRESACVTLDVGERCLVACAHDEDCGVDQVCRAAADGTSYCFDASGDCGAPAVVEPDPEHVEEVEPDADVGDDTSTAEEVSVKNADSGGCAGGGSGAPALLLAVLACLARRRRRLG